MHYAVPRIFYDRGNLYKLYTDAFYQRGKYSHRLLAAFFPKAASYQIPIPDQLISGAWPEALWHKFLLKKSPPPQKPFVHQTISRALVRRIAKREKHGDPNAVYGFDTAAKELFEWAAAKEKTRILEQCVAPRAAQIKLNDLIRSQAGLKAEAMDKQDFDLYRRREEREWALANCILCPSEYVRDELLAAGAEEQKIRIVPYGLGNPLSRETLKDRLKRKFSRPPSDKIRILFVGNDSFRKGLHDLIAVGKMLPESKYILRIAGQNSWQKTRLPFNIFLLGKLGKEELTREYLAADIFALPSYLEGSATVIYEALSFGLPIVTTPNAGSVVQHQIQGFIHQPGDQVMLLNYLQQLAEDRQLRKKMAYAAFLRMKDYSLKAYGRRLMEAIQPFLEAGGRR